MNKILVYKNMKTNKRHRWSNKTCFKICLDIGF